MHTSPLAGKNVQPSSFCSEWEGEWHQDLLRSQHPCRKSHTKIETCGRVFFVSCETTVAMGWSNMSGQAHHFFFASLSSCSWSMCSDCRRGIYWASLKTISHLLLLFIFAPSRALRAFGTLTKSKTHKVVDVPVNQTPDGKQCLWEINQFSLAAGFFSNLVNFQSVIVWWWSTGALNAADGPKRKPHQRQWGFQN